MKDRGDLVTFIFARGGSKGIRRKNLRPLGGIPLIGHAINCARASSLVDRIVVSTDSDEIADVARSFGAEVPFLRPDELSQNATPELLAWKHAISKLRELDGEDSVRGFVSVPTVAPFRATEDLDKCLERFISCDADLVCSAVESTANPYFNLLRVNDHGYAETIFAEDAMVFRRQDAPVVYRIVPSVYAARPEYILGANYLLEGRCKLVPVPPDRALDLDTEFDWQIAECMVEKHGIGMDR
jgi:N-acylneuraminate cytidylyltransferase